MADELTDEVLINDVWEILKNFTRSATFPKPLEVIRLLINSGCP